MQTTDKRVDESIGVSSMIKAKLSSIVFCLFFFSIGTITFGYINTSVASDITIDNVVGLTNQSRMAASKTALVINQKLSEAAEAKAADMAANNYFSHTSPAGATPWVWIQGKDYDYNYAGENLAMDFRSAERMEEAWMASPTHRANIINDKYKEIGVAVREGNINGKGTLLVVVMFGSGDKNISSAANAKTEAAIQEKITVEHKIPVLPSGEKRKELVSFLSPVITSPQTGKIISDSAIEITGRAKPGEMIDVYDNKNFIASISADLNGWFSTTEENLSKGNHQLTIAGKNKFFETITNYTVDRDKPNVHYHLYADKEKPYQLYVEASADKNNCTLQLGLETRVVARGSRTLFVLDPEKLSSILRVSDQAGNKSFRQINIANYHIQEQTNNFSGKLVDIFVPNKNIFAADSGREAVRSNLGIAPHPFLASRITAGN